MLRARMRRAWMCILLAAAVHCGLAERCWARGGRNQGVMAAQRRMLKAIAASRTWPLALANPT